MSDAPQTIRRATLGIALLVLISKGIGFVREMIIAYRFGTGIEYDIYLVAVTIPIALFTLISGFSNLFIPAYSEAVNAPDRDCRMRALWADANIVFLGAVVLATGIAAAAPIIVRLIAPGLDAALVPPTAFMMRVASLIVVVALLETFFRSILNGEKRFLIPAAGPIVANIVLITSIVALADSLSTQAILYGLVAGYLAQMLFVYVPFRSSAVARFFHLGIFREHTGRFLVTAAIIVIIEGASQVYAIVDRYFASSMDAGIISALGYATILFLLPVSIFAYALSTAVFPYMTDAVARGDRDRSGALLSRGITISLLLAVPLMILFWQFSEQMVTLLFRRGAFNAESVARTSNLLKFFVLGMAGQFLLWFMSRAYYAARKYPLLIVNVVVVLAVKTIAAAVFVTAWQAAGLAISSSLSYSVGALVLVAFAGRSLAPVDWKSILMYVIKLLSAAVPMYIAGELLFRALVAHRVEFVSLVWRTPLAMFGAAVVFLAAGYLLKIPDIRNLAAILRGDRSQT